MKKPKSTIKIGNTSITFMDANSSYDTKHLEKLYDTINKIAINLEKKGINVDKMFYSEEELNLIRSSKAY